MSHRKGCGSHKFHAASTKLRPFVCISSPPIGCYVLLVLRRHLGDGTTEVAGEGLAIAVELHERVDVGFALATAQRPIDSHVYNLHIQVSPVKSLQLAAQIHCTHQVWTCAHPRMPKQQSWLFTCRQTILLDPKESSRGLDEARRVGKQW